jgi:hypothetical protein
MGVFVYTCRRPATIYYQWLFISMRKSERLGA